MRGKIARIPCASKLSLLKMPDASKACSVGPVETVGKRIARLRNSKGWTRPELGRQMGTALSRKAFSGEMVRLYEEGTNRPGKEARRALAQVFDRPESYIEFGDPTHAKQPKSASKAAPDEAVAQNAREKMILLLFRGLTPEQQRELILKTNAQVVGNREIQARFLNKPLRTFSNEEVEAAVGKVPSPVKHKKRHSSHKPGREPGDAMGDFLNDE